MFVTFWSLCVTCGSCSRCASVSSSTKWTFLLVECIGGKQYVKVEYYGNNQKIWENICSLKCCHQAVYDIVSLEILCTYQKSCETFSLIFLLRENHGCHKTRSILDSFLKKLYLPILLSGWKKHATWNSVFDSVSTLRNDLWYFCYRHQSYSVT